MKYEYYHSDCNKWKQLRENRQFHNMEAFAEYVAWFLFSREDYDPECWQDEIRVRQVDRPETEKKFELSTNCTITFYANEVEE